MASQTRQSKKRAGTKTGPKQTESSPPCACGCGRPAQISFSDELFYTRACFQKEIDGLRALGIPIEQGPEGVRLAPHVRVQIIDGPDDPPEDKAKLH